MNGLEYGIKSPAIMAVAITIASWFGGGGKLGLEERAEDCLLEIPVQANARVHDKIIDKHYRKYAEKLGNLPFSQEAVKAVMRVESGNSKAFFYDPMQIANEGDPALDVLINSLENTYLITDEEFRKKLKTKKKTPWIKTKKAGYRDYSRSNMEPETSIEGGIAWLIHKAAVYSFRDIEEGEFFAYRAEKGDTLDRIAKKQGTTMNTILKYNPETNAKSLRAGEILSLKKARARAYISGWRSQEDAIKRYNGGGDPHYVRKVCSLLF